MSLLPLLVGLEQFLRASREPIGDECSDCEHSVACAVCECCCDAREERQRVATELLIQVIDARFALERPARAPLPPPSPGSLRARYREAVGLCVTCGGAGRVACDDPSTVGMPCPACSGKAIAPDARQLAAAQGGGQ